jgi:two-component system OmpR family sensor kinase
MAAATVTSVTLLRGFLDDRSAEALRGSAQRVREVLARGPQVADAEQFSALLRPPMGVVVLADDGTVGIATGAAEAAPQRLATLTADSPGQVVAHDAEGLSSLLAIRVDSPGLTVVSDDQDPVEASALVLVTDSSVDDSTERRLVVYHVCLMLAFLGLLTALAVVVLRVGLRPLRRLAATADSVAEGSFAARLPVGEGPTETDVLARAVNRAFDAQARAEAAARDFAADASHELRTPLATISGWLDLHHQGAIASGDIGEAVGHIDGEVGRMRLIVDELGLLARLDAGRPLEQDLVDLVELAASVVEDAGVIDPSRQLSLDAVGPVRVRGDAPRLMQVLRNLVGNAVQHTPQTASVRVAVEGSAAGARVIVADDGPGIAAEDVPRVFERFWRAEPSRSRSHGGSGLGLAIVEAIVRAHGGTVVVRSTTIGTPTGTQVLIDLPAGTAAATRPPEH